MKEERKETGREESKEGKEEREMRKRGSGIWSSRTGAVE